MAYETHVTVCNQFGRAIATIEPNIHSVAWRLNNESMAKFSMSWRDPKCTQDNLAFGNRIVVEWDNGLPDWGGVIDVPRGRTVGKVSFTAYSGERLLNWRITGKSASYSAQTAGAIAQARLENANAASPTGISVGTIQSTGTTHTLEDHYHDVLQRTIDLARLSGQDFYIKPTFSGGVLTFALYWYTARGTDYSDSVWLHDKNLAADPLLDEQGPLHNAIALVGEGTTWGEERLTSASADATSQAAYGYREYSEVQNVTDSTTLDSNAAALLAAYKDPHNVCTIYALNKAPATFGGYDVGDTIGVRLFEDNAAWYWSANVRVLAREWAPDDVCRLEVQEV